jgi:hypothetical protein
MSRLSRVILTTFTAGAVLNVPTFADNDWSLLASRRVAAANPSGVVEIPRTEGRFDALRFEVRGGAIEIYDLRVHFANADPFSPPGRLTVGAGEQSRIIELPGQARLIDRIVFRYRTGSRDKPLEIRVLGREAQDGPGRAEEVPEPRPQPGGEWIHLGAREVDLRSDRDVITAGGQRRFNSLLIAVEGANVEIHGIRVNFANGERFEPQVRLVFEQNTRSRFIDLPGTTRDIRNIEFQYRTLPGSSTQKAVVHVYGRTMERGR